MRTQLDKRLVIAPALFALVAVILTVLAWGSFGGSLPLGARSYRVGFTVAQAANLQPRAAVRAAGVNIGHVVSVSRAGSGAHVTVELDAAYAPIRADARFAIRAKSLLGEAYVELALGTRAATAVPEGGELPVTAGVPTQQLDDLLSTFDPRTRAGVRRFVRGFSAAVSGRALDLNRTLGEAPLATGELADLTAIADRQRGSLRTLIERGGDVLTQAGEQQGALTALVREGNALFDVTARRDAALTRIVRALPGFLEQVRQAGNGIAAAAPELRAATASLEPVAPAFDPALASLQQALPDVRRLLTALPATLRSARQGLPSLTRLLVALKPTFAALYPALREIVPPIQFIAEDPSFVTATAANLAAAANTYVPGPGGTKQRYVRAVPMLWNEMAAGFQKQLPTSRQNQYPRPGTLGRVGKGPLEAWSCDNLGNEQTVPVIPPGTGAPPCVVQGPYDYRGKRVWYPRLERAGR